MYFVGKKIENKLARNETSFQVKKTCCLDALELSDYEPQLAHNLDSIQNRDSVQIVVRSLFSTTKNTYNLPKNVAPLRLRHLVFLQLHTLPLLTAGHFSY